MKQIPARVKLMLHVEGKRPTEPGYSLVSRLELQEDDEYIIIDAPMIGDTLYPMPVKATILAHFTDPKALFVFKGVVVGRLKRDDLPFIRIRITSDLVRTQRRADFRMDVSLKGEFLVPLETQTKKTTYENHRCVIVNISGGGVGVVTDYLLKTGEKVIVVVPVEGEDMQVQAEVRRVIRQEPEERFPYMAGLRFLYEGTRQKDKIVKQIFRMQQQKARH